MGSFDSDIISFLNQFAQRSYTFDQIMVFVSSSHLLKGGVFAILFWWLWFRRHGSDKSEHDGTRARVMTMIVACFISVFAVRVLAASIPFKIRPIHNADLNFVAPHDMNTDILQTWSSFPSDHAAMFFALAVSLWFISRSLGVLSLIYVAVVICVPRVYLGLYYPTDMVAGTAIGGAAAWVASGKVIRRLVDWRTSSWSRVHPASFYAFFFFVTFQVAVIFDDVREISSFVLHVLKVTVGSVG